MLGKNGLFDAIWDAIKSMQKEGLLSLATFASVFGSYVIADEVKGAFMTFDVMDQYGCVRDIVALNSLLSAICRDGKTLDAKEFLQVARAQIRPDSDTYAILLEGWESEQDAVNARQTFEEMVAEIGWYPNNFPAYDSLSNTVLKGSDGLKEAMKLFETLKDRSCYPGMRFYKAALNECLIKGDMKNAIVLWGVIKLLDGCKPDTELYNLMISVYLNLEDDDLAVRMLDEMIFNGVVPDSQSYNLIFRFLITEKKLKEAQSVFTEMIKNEFVPTHENCYLAVGVFVEGGDPSSAIKVWKCVVENYETDLEEMGNILVTGLRDLNRLPEAVKYAEDMIDRGIELTSACLSKVRQALAKAGKGPVYDALFNKWKLHQIDNPSTSGFSVDACSEREKIHEGETRNDPKRIKNESNMARPKNSNSTTSVLAIREGGVKRKRTQVSKGKGKGNSDPKPKGKGSVHSEIPESKDPKEAVCFHCQEKGHWKRSCPKYLEELKKPKTKKVLKKPKSKECEGSVHSEIPQSKNPQEAVCFHCKDKGHWKRNCPKYLEELKNLKKLKTKECGTSGLKLSRYLRAGPDHGQ